MASTKYFEFLGTVWDQMSIKDRRIFVETWSGYEQIFAAVYQRYVESNLNLAVKDLLPYNTERWLPYVFDETNVLFREAVYIATQDLSLGVNLSSKYLLRLSVNGEPSIEVDLRGPTPSSTKISEIINKLNDAFGFKIASTHYDGTVVKLTSNLKGPLSSIQVLPTSEPIKNAAEFVLGIQALDLPAKFPKFPHTYSLPYPRVASIPTLRDSIRDENLEVELTEGIDYIVEDQTTISFAVPPLDKMWAKRTLIDEETPFNNYGYLMDIYQPTSQRYVEVLQGLWFAFWTGPKPSNVKTSLYLLFGLPVARENGVVTGLTVDKITVTYRTGAIQEFNIPSGLLATVVVGQQVLKFDPLVNGIEVYDKINKPGFIKDEIGREGIERFLTESATRGPGEDTDETRALKMMEEYTFLPQISVDAFISPDINLGNVKIFLEAIKPLNQTFLFQVIVGSFKDVLDIKESLGFDIEIDLTPSVDSNETSYQSPAILDAYETVIEDGLAMDPDSILLLEETVIEVRQASLLIDNFTV